MLPLFVVVADKFPFSSLPTDESEADEFFITISTWKDLSFPSDSSSDPHLFISLLGFSEWKIYIGNIILERQIRKQHCWELQES